MNQVIHIFKNADMRNQHDGLAELARKGEKLNLNVIQEIPRCFDAKAGMNWEAAEKIALEKLFAKEKI